MTESFNSVRTVHNGGWATMHARRDVAIQSRSFRVELEPFAIDQGCTHDGGIPAGVPSLNEEDLRCISSTGTLALHLRNPNLDPFEARIRVPRDLLAGQKYQADLPLKGLSAYEAKVLLQVARCRLPNEYEADLILRNFREHLGTSARAFWTSSQYEPLAYDRLGYHATEAFWFSNAVPKEATGSVPRTVLIWTGTGDVLRLGADPVRYDVKNIGVEALKISWRNVNDDCNRR